MLCTQHAHRIKSVLANPETWSNFTREDLEEIGAKFPEYVPRNEDGSISAQWLRYDNDWRHGVRQWQDDLEAGRLDPEWQKQAAAAVAERAAGHFDKYKDDEFEEFWGQKQKRPPSMLAGESATLKLPDLVAANLFKKGDYWVFCKVFVRETDRIEVVKDCKVESTSSTCLAKSFSNSIQIEAIGIDSLTFAIPPGTLRHARKITQDNSQKAGGQGLATGPDEEDVVRYTVFNVQMLENKILELDGRTSPPYTRGNAWKQFRCQRDNQDMGSLYEVREGYYVFRHPH